MPDAPNQTASPAPKETKYLVLTKGEERFCFLYEVGEESQVLDALVEKVNRREGFDWFDAAVLSHQLGQNLASELKSFLPKKAVQS